MQSNLLNEYPNPGISNGYFQLALLVSQGYTVFIPEMQIKPGAPGESALRSINAAVDHLSTIPWFNNEKIGVFGESFAGYLTNYIVTHSSRFTVAVSTCGVSDLISASTSLWDTGARQDNYYKKVVDLGEDITDNPGLYIKNSPIFAVKNVNTPLLLIHNSKDGSVDFRQSRSLFILLRSLKKPVWWINYPEEFHGLSKETNRIDCYRKILGFLDYKLKDEAKPEWMCNPPFFRTAF